MLMARDDHPLSKKIELEKSVVIDLVDIVAYVSGSVISKSILRKKSGTITVSSFDAGEIWPVKASPFDNMIQILDGEADIIIDDKLTTLRKGQTIVIPAHVWNSIKANEPFKMVSIIIKSGYEDVTL